MAPRRQNDELPSDEQEPLGATDEIPFDPWGDEDDPSERRRDPLRVPAAQPPDPA